MAEFVLDVREGVWQRVAAMCTLRLFYFMEVY